jgi:hypothetical protein
MTVALAAPPQRQYFAYAGRNAGPRNELRNEAQLVHAVAVGTVVEDDSSRGSVGSIICCRQISPACYERRGGLRSCKATLPRLIEDTGLAGKWRPSGHFFPLRKSQTFEQVESRTDFVSDSVRKLLFLSLSHWVGHILCKQAATNHPKRCAILVKTKVDCHLLEGRLPFFAS